MCPSPDQRPSLERLAQALTAVERADAAALEAVQAQDQATARRGTVLQRMDEVRRLLGALACEELPAYELLQIATAEAALDTAFENAAKRTTSAEGSTVFAQGSAQAPVDYLDV